LTLYIEYWATHRGKTFDRLAKLGLKIHNMYNIKQIITIISINCVLCESHLEIGCPRIEEVNCFYQHLQTYFKRHTWRGGPES
jgi:hypothetical protein